VAPDSSIFEQADHYRLSRVRERLMEGPAVIDVLKQYPDRYRANRFAPPPQGPGFSTAVVLQVQTPAGLFCLRGWPPETSEPERIRGLHRLLAHIRSQGVGFLPVPVSATDGQTLVPYEGRWWHIEPWMQGRADFWSNPSDPRLKAAMVALARIHRAAATFEPVSAEKKWFASLPNAIAPSVSERFDSLSNWTSERLSGLCKNVALVSQSDPDFCCLATVIIDRFRRCHPAISHELRLARNNPVPVQPCLRDVWHDHVLFEGDAVAGIVDPSAARADTVAADISRLLGSLIGDDRPAWERGLAAYQTVRPLSCEEAILVGVLDRSGVLLSGMTWLSRRFLEGVQFADPERVIERIERIACRLKSIAQATS
jgi:Ser/Thr protein kinase RdoA (MazF antagonist)